ncbi:MAG: hypothetical protein EOP86_12575, partial [Verrucomicrobiaceae bacterium]
MMAGNKGLTTGLLLVYCAGMTMPPESIPVSFTSLRDRGTVPGWAAGFNARGATLDQINQENPLAGIVVLRAPALQEIEGGGGRLSTLAAHLRAAP